MAARPTRRPRTALAVIAAGVLTLAACGDDGASDDAAASDDDVVAELDGREFVSSDVDGIELAEGSQIRISFQDDELAVVAGCNNMGGGYTVTEAVLVADQLFMTEMACPEPLMEQDAWLAGFLAAGAAVDLDGDELTLTGEAATIVLVDREVAEPDLALEGTVWTIDGIVSSDAVSSLVAGTEASLLIEGDTAAVDTGCNTANGAVEIDEATGTITFGPLATTLMACPDEIMQQEAAILTVLSGAVTYEIEGDGLSLTNVADQGIGLRATADR